MASEPAKASSRSKLAWSITASLVAVLIAATMDSLGWLDGFENVTWSWRANASARPSPSTDRIKIITLDQGSLDWGSKENDLRWPWPRELYARIIDFCTRSGAKCVAFDVLFSEPSDLIGDDERLGSAIAANQRFVAGFFTGDQAQQTRVWPPNIPKPALDLGDATDHPSTHEPRAAFPVLPIATNAVALATVREAPDDDGKFRRVTAFRLFDGTTVPSLGLAAFLVSSGESNRVRRVPGGIQVNSHVIPLDAQDRAILRFRGKSGTHRNFTASSVIQSEVRLLEKQPPTVSTNEFRDAFVFFGFSAPGLKDLRPTPTDGGYPATELHATFMDNLLQDDFLRTTPWWPVAITTLIISLTASLQVLLSGGLRGMLGGAAVFMLVPIETGFAAYANGYWWPVAWPAMAVTLSVAGSLFWNLSSEGRQRRFLKSAFRQYLSHEVIENLLERPDSLRLGGERRELTMFFSDLEKFSSFSEKLDPETLTLLLNDFLTGATRIIQEEGGTLDKYVGDAVVAFWNAPVAQPDHALRACRAAVRVQRWIEENRAEFERRAGAPFRLRIGLHTGYVNVGNFGSETRFNYTILGDAANLASRLEGVNKFFGTFTMASDATWQLASSGLIGRELGKLRVVGRKEPVRVHEIIGLAGDPLPSHVKSFLDGMKLCQNRFRDALSAFEANLSDPPSRLYAAKCLEVLNSGENQWDMVWNMTEK